jgi:hypothetical protein
MTGSAHAPLEIREAIVQQSAIVVFRVDAVGTVSSWGRESTVDHMGSCLTCQRLAAAASI